MIQPESVLDDGLASADNTSEALEHLRSVNVHYRTRSWPAPFRATTHDLRVADGRKLSWIADESVHLVVTSPPYFTLKAYERRDGQMGEIADYELFFTMP